MHESIRSTIGAAQAAEPVGVPRVGNRGQGVAGPIVSAGRLLVVAPKFSQVLLFLDDRVGGAWYGLARRRLLI